MDAATELTRRRTVSIIALVAGILGCAVYLNTLPNGFVLDDTPAVLENPAAHWPPDLGAIVSTNYWGSPRDYEHLTIYRPLATLTFALEEAVHGPAPWGYHLTNALLHGVVAALVVLLGAAIFGRRREGRVAAGFAGLVFALHPVHTEAVAAAVSRAELLAAGFVVATLLCALRARAPGARRGRWWGAATAAFALGLLSKENAATALLMLPLLDAARWFERRRSPSAVESQADVGPAVAWPLLVACGVVLGAYFALRAAVLPALLGGAVPPSDNPIVAAAGGPERWLTPFAVYLESWRTLLWPASLSVDYTAHALPVATSWLDPRGVAGAALFAGTIGLALVWVRRRPAWSLAIGLFLAAYAVVSHLAFPATIIFAERLLYLPSVGVCLLFGAWLAWLTAARRPRPLRAVAWALAAVALVLAGGRTVARNADWRDELTLYATSVVETPRSARLQNNLGRLLLESGDLPRAVRALQTAVQLDPDNFAAWSNLGQAALAVGEWDAAGAALREALARKPDLVAALNNRCVLERRRGRPATGLDACRRAVARAPELPMVHWNYVRALTAAGLVEQARAALDEARTRFPGHDELPALERALSPSASPAPSALPMPDAPRPPASSPAGDPSTATRP